MASAICVDIVAWLASYALAVPATLKSGHLNRRYIEERDGVTYNVFEHRATGAKMSYVKNSGICETTAGVNQYSGYLSVGENKNMFFWFFEARHNASTAPLATWFNGGPACSSMIGLFQENGPCQFTYLPADYDYINHTSKPSLNPYSWNEYANMLYIDQPIGTGFSYGDETVNSTATAAVDVWKLLQAFYAEFPAYQSRDFGIWTESYGGHFGPAFTLYIRDQNAAIERGDLSGDLERINQIALGINNGWFDQVIQQKSYIEFSYQNNYKQLINATQRDSLYNDYTTQCLPALEACEKTKADADCAHADDLCYDLVEGAIANAPGSNFDVYDIRQPGWYYYPPVTYAWYLAEDYVRAAIGANKTYYAECEDSPYDLFVKTGDDARSFLTQLSDVVQSGVRVLLWAGDTDWICNWIGNKEVAESVVYSGQAEFKNKTMVPYTVNGTEKGSFKTVDNLTFLKVNEAGHTLPYWQPELSLQVFIQTMQQKPIIPT